MQQVDRRESPPHWIGRPPKPARQPELLGCLAALGCTEDDQQPPEDCPITLWLRTQPLSALPVAFDHMLWLREDGLTPSPADLKPQPGHPRRATHLYMNENYRLVGI